MDRLKARLLSPNAVPEDCVKLHDHGGSLSRRSRAQSNPVMVRLASGVLPPASKLHDQGLPLWPRFGAAPSSQQLLGFVHALRLGPAPFNYGIHFTAQNLDFYPGVIELLAQASYFISGNPSAVGVDGVTNVLHIVLRFFASVPACIAAVETVVARV